jgi:hypothetical protein
VAPCAQGGRRTSPPPRRSPKTRRRARARLAPAPPPFVAGEGGGVGGELPPRTFRSARRFPNAVRPSGNRPASSHCVRTTQSAPSFVMRASSTSITPSCAPAYSRTTPTRRAMARGRAAPRAHGACFVAALACARVWVPSLCNPKTFAFCGGRPPARPPAALPPVWATPRPGAASAAPETHSASAVSQVGRAARLTDKAKVARGAARSHPPGRRRGSRGGPGPPAAESEGMGRQRPQGRVCFPPVSCLGVAGGVCLRVIWVRGSTAESLGPRGTDFRPSGVSFSRTGHH